VRKTATGLFVESVRINAKSTYYSGISEKNVKLLVYTFSGFCAGVAGLILSSYVHSTDALHRSWLRIECDLGRCVGRNIDDGRPVSFVGQCDWGPRHLGLHDQHVHVWCAGSGLGRQSSARLGRDSPLL
jgi:hypothetical protein